MIQEVGLYDFSTKIIIIECLKTFEISSKYTSYMYVYILPNSPESTISYKQMHHNYIVSMAVIDAYINILPLQIVYTVIMKIITKIYPLKTNFVVVSSSYRRTAKLLYKTKNNPSFATTQCIVSQCFSIPSDCTHHFGFSYVFHLYMHIDAIQSCLCMLDGKLW